MTLPQYTTTTYFNTGTISARTLQTTFGGNSNNIKFSTYRRNTNQDETNPIVPDADENADISSENNLSIETFRGSIKQISATQSGSDTDLDLDSSSIWGGNLNKNVIKNLSITGTIIASTNTTFAAALDAEVYNLKVDVSGQIYGQGGGTGGSSNGGSALYLNNTTTRSGESRNIDVTVNSTGRIWAGGGAGSSGSSGSAGPALACFENTNYAVNTNFGDNRAWYESLANSACANSAPSGYQSGYALYGNPNDLRVRCRGGGYRRGDGWNASNRTGYACATNWSLTCQAIRNYNVAGGAGGNGGTGGTGAGWNTRGSWSTNYPINDTEFNSANTSGNSGNSGGTSNCAANSTSSTGNAGSSGNSGGQWGSAGAGGNAGSALSGRLYRVVSGDTGTGHLQRIKGTKS